MLKLIKSNELYTLLIFLLTVKLLIFVNDFSTVAAIACLLFYRFKCENAQAKTPLINEASLKNITDEITSVSNRIGKLELGAYISKTSKFE